ncbi:hypothetical protein ABZ714_08670 [Streptomyces sp. NPDC006798]|uniref:hypothetical protein n=1 Tax=Streptomyces sp. NPDC006798 TaxID=3155462 RepID=UPI0033F1B039
MSKSIWRRAGLSLTAVAVIAGASACGGEDDKKKAADNGSQTKIQSGAEVTKVLQAAYKKTEEAKTAKVNMVMTMPKMGDEPGGQMTMDGVMGWDPMMIDVTAKGAALTAGAGAGGPEQIRMVWLKDVMYMDMGAAAAKEMGMDGKRWMKMDLAALAKESGDPAIQKQLTGGLDSMDQSPAEQLAVLLESKSIKHVGPAKVGGVDTQHYKGTISVAEMLKANKSLVLDETERKQLTDGMKEAGITSYDTQVWVNGDGFPVKMDVSMATKEGPVKMVSNYTDYGTKASVTAPPANQTFDFAAMLKEMGAAMEEGATS